MVPEQRSGLQNVRMREIAAQSGSFVTHLTCRHIIPAARVEFIVCLAKLYGQLQASATAMPAQTLAQLARKACIKNVNSITDIGDAEYSVVRPILLKLQNPKQLYQLEQNCPQIIGADAEIWREFCKRDIPDYEKNPQEPANPKSWYKCYQKLYKAGQKEIDADAALLKATMDDIKSKQAQKKAQQVELRGVKVPSGLKKDIPTIALPKGSSVYRGMGHAREYNREFVDKGPPKPVSTLAKIRRETAAQSHFTAAKQLQRGIITPRDAKTPAMKSTVKAAPRYLIEEHQKAKIPEPIDPTVQKSPVFNPKKRRIEHVELAETASSSRESREKRLRALTNPSGTGSPLSSTINPTIKTTPPLQPLSKADSSHRQQLVKADAPQQSFSQSHPTNNKSSPGRPSSSTGIRSRSPISRASTSSPKIRPPMRVHRGPDNPLVAMKRRPLTQT